MCHNMGRFETEYIDIETYCPIKQKQVTLTLECLKPQGEIVKGKPIFCSEKDCSGDFPKDMLRCFLNSMQIETKRKP